MVFINEILTDIEWRLTQLVTIRTLPIKYNLSTTDREVHNRTSIPAIYALWEGFVKEAFSIYARYLDSLQLSRDEINIVLLTHELDSLCDFQSSRENLKAKVKLVEAINEKLKPVISISKKVPTKSNVNYKVLKDIFDRFCISLTLDKSIYGSKIDRFLLFRNACAHGDNSIQINNSDLDEFYKLVEDLMYEVAVCLEHSAIHQDYKGVQLAPTH